MTITKFQSKSISNPDVSILNIPSASDLYRCRWKIPVCVAFFLLLNLTLAWKPTSKIYDIPFRGEPWQGSVGLFLALVAFFISLSAPYSQKRLATRSPLFLMYPHHIWHNIIFPARDRGAAFLTKILSNLGNMNVRKIFMGLWEWFGELLFVRKHLEHIISNFEDWTS